IVLRKIPRVPDCIFLDGTGETVLFRVNLVSSSARAGSVEAFCASLAPDLALVDERALAPDPSSSPLPEKRLDEDGAGGKGDLRRAPLLGAGATFPYPLYWKWILEYEKARPGVKIDYQAVGSGGGKRQLFEETV